MGLSVAAKFQVKFEADVDISPTRSELSTPGSNLILPFDSEDRSLTWTNGTGVDQANQAHSGRASHGTTIDLESWTDQHGQTGLAFARIKAVLFQNISTGADFEVVGNNPGVITPWSTDAIQLPRGGQCFVFLVAPDATGWAISTGVNNQIIINRTAGSGGNVDYALIGVNV